MATEGVSRARVWVSRSSLRGGGELPCDHVRATIIARLQEVDERICELQDLRSTLVETLARLDTLTEPVPGCRCAIIESA